MIPVCFSCARFLFFSGLDSFAFATASQVGEEGSAKVEQEQKRVYKANHHAVIDKIEELFEESKNKLQKTQQKEVNLDTFFLPFLSLFFVLMIAWISKFCFSEYSLCQVSQAWSQEQKRLHRNSSIINQSQLGSVTGQTPRNALKDKSPSEKMVIIKNDLSTILEGYGVKDPGPESPLTEPVSMLWMGAIGEGSPLTEPVSKLGGEAHSNKEDSIPEDPADHGPRGEDGSQSPCFNESHILVLNESHSWNYQASAIHAPPAATGTGAGAPAQTSEGRDQQDHGALAADVGPKQGRRSEYSIPEDSANHGSRGEDGPKQGRRLKSLPPSQRRKRPGPGP